MGDRRKSQETEGRSMRQDQETGAWSTKHEDRRKSLETEERSMRQDQETGA
jgi:hypothetical protein